MFTTAKLQHFDSYLMIITYFLLLDFYFAFNKKLFYSLWLAK